LFNTCYIISIRLYQTNELGVILAMKKIRKLLPPTALLLATVTTKQLTLVSAFQHPAPHLPLYHKKFQPAIFSKISSSLTATIPQDNFDLENLERGITEVHRRDRRDFFDHEAWVRHRGSNRFFDNMLAIPFSKVVWMLTSEVLCITIISIFVLLWNHGLVVGWEDLDGAFHAPLVSNFPLLSLPLEPFVLSSPALALLLVFRTKGCWFRWDEARKSWGVIVNNSRTIARKTSSWIMESDLPYEEKQALLVRVADAVWAFARAERRHLLSKHEDEEDFIVDVMANLREPFASDLIKNKRHRPSFALFELTCAINELPLDMFRRNHIEESVSQVSITRCFHNVAITSTKKFLPVNSCVTRWVLVIGSILLLYQNSTIGIPPDFYPCG